MSPSRSHVWGGGMVAAYRKPKSSINFSKTTMNDRIGEHLRVQRGALSLLVQRQELIASNIANADTPHFKARDIDFQEALQIVWPGIANGV